MAEKIISPGIFTRENDQSLVTRAPQETGMAVVGPTVKGSPLVPTYVTSYSEYESMFGSTFKSGSNYYEYFTSIAARDYFNSGGRSLLVTRIISGSSNIGTYASASIPNLTSAVAGTKASASFTVSSSDTGSWNQIHIGVSTIYGNIDYSITNHPYTATGSSFSGTNIVYVGVGTNGTNQVSSNTNWAEYVAKAVNNAGNEISSRFSASYVGEKLIFTVKENGASGNNYSFTSSFGYGAPSYTTFSGGSDGVNGTSFEIEALTWGDISNNSGSILSSGALTQGTSDNVRWEISNSDSTKGTFTLLVRRGDDNNVQKNVLESWTNLSLDPMQPNFISRVIGDQKQVYIPAANGDTAYIQTTGSYTNSSRYIRVKSITQPNVNSIDNDGNFLSSSYANTLPVTGSGSIGGAFTGGVSDTNAQKLCFESITNNNIQGFSAYDYIKAIDLLQNKDEYNFNLIVAPGVTLSNQAADNLISMCESRGDCMVIIDNQLYGGTVNGAITNAQASTSNYAATYWPWVQVFSSNLGKAVWVPASTVMGGVYAFNDQVGAEWFAPAGLNRGGIASVIQAERKLTQNDRDILYNANVNPLATFPGSGVVAWGQKTLQKRSTALDRVAVRRLLINLKRYLTQVGGTLLFEQNTTALRNSFLAKANPYLESVVQRQGLYAFQVVMDESNNTADVIDRNQLIGQIRIQPTKTAEFIILDFNIQPSGVSFS